MELWDQQNRWLLLLQRLRKGSWNNNFLLECENYKIVNLRGDWYLPVSSIVFLIFLHVCQNNKDYILTKCKGQILRSTPNTAPLICGACYSIQPEALSTTASVALILFHQCFHRQVRSPADLPTNTLHSNKHSGHLHGLFR